MDTPIVNGEAYPNMTVLPQAYRFRILSAADDRFFNLMWFVADANVTTADGRNNTEVKMVPAYPGAPGFPDNWPTDGREGGVPDPATQGPSWIQVGTEGGFLPAPVVIPPQPITYITDPTRFDYGNADKHSLLLAAAERADVIVDFSQYAGKTLILYNDAPAAFPAGISQYDYYTGAPDRTSTGGAPSILAGYGPNVRTIMQVIVANTSPAAPYNVATLNAVFANTSAKRGVFEVSQPPIILPQKEYDSAYNRTITATNNNWIRIFDSHWKFTTLSGTRMDITFQPKALHDEMGAVYDEYGRMSGMLGLELPSGTSVTQTFTPYPYSSPPTDVIMTSIGAMNGTAPGDGTQIWKITHNGVDTHPLHWHMYNVQVISRAPWDGLNVMGPDPNELGWKETVRVSPLEDTYVALRPVTATVPFDVPDNIRAINPNMPLGATLDGPPGGFFDPAENPITVTNHLVNFGWEYVWHCHILAHEEMDMMHSQVIAVNKPTNPPDGLISGEVKTGLKTAVYLAWMDRSTNETHWIIQRRNLTDANWYDLKRVPSYSIRQTGVWAMAVDNSIPANTPPHYAYRVEAVNVVGDTFVYAGSTDGFPTYTLASAPSAINLSHPMTPPTASFTLSPASGPVPLNVTFTDTSTGTPLGWIWDFGDGNYAWDTMKQNPSHIYEIPGNYTVTLIAMNTGGQSPVSAPRTVTVTVGGAYPAPVARFTGTPTTGTQPLTVSFNAGASTSTPAASATWLWTFGDGSFSSVKNATHTYTKAGSYTVSLAATNLGGTNVTTKVGYITVTPHATQLGVFRPSTQQFRLRNGSVTTVVTFGLSTDKPVTGDWNGDGMGDVGGFRPSTQQFRLKNGSVTTVVTFGLSTDKPVTGDWNGDGIWDVGVFRPSTQQFRLKNGSATTIVTFGQSSDTPVTGDWNGDGIWDVGVFRNSTHQFLLKNGSVTTTINFGLANDLPVTGDWNADGLTDVGIFRPSSPQFRLKNGSVTTAVSYGQINDLPVTGKWS